MRHLAAFYSNAALGGVLTALAAVPDTQIFTSGNILRVSPDVPLLAMAYGAYLATTITQGQIETPSLRALANFDVSPLSLTGPVADSQSFDDLYDAPLTLAGNESMTFSVNGTSTGAQDAYGIVEFTDGAVKPVSGNIFTVRGTGAATLSAGVFVNTPVIFDTVLPAGSYNVVGLRAEGANLVAARIAFVGQTYRPGVLGITASNQSDNLRYRNGASGTFGAFNINQPPTVDCLGITDTAQVFYFDLQKTK